MITNKYWSNLLVKGIYLMDEFNIKVLAISLEVKYP